MADLSLLQEDLQEEIDGFGVDDYSSESDVIIIPSALDFVSQDEMLTPLGRLDKYAASENIFNRTWTLRTSLDMKMTDAWRPNLIAYRPLPLANCNILLCSFKRLDSA